jgi:hypothetical protein
LKVKVSLSDEQHPKAVADSHNKFLSGRSKPGSLHAVI